MRLEQLHYIIEIADTGSFTMASERLFVAQPSVSQAVTALEKELNLTLFTRYRTGAVPTPMGLKVIAYARDILKNVENIRTLSEGDHAKIKTRVTIASIPTLSTAVLPNVIERFRDSFPNVIIRIREEGTERVISECLSGAADLGLVSSHGKRTFDDKLIFRHLINGHLMAYVGKASPLAERKRISFRDLLPFQLFLYGDEFSLHQYCLERIGQYGEPNIMSTTHNPESIKRFVMRTQAVGFGPDISLLDDIYVKDGEIIPLEITDAEEIQFGLLTKKERKPDLAADSLIREILS
jgi:LysR family transcriptional regulator, transcription activator of glutamate synthase operon